MQTALLYSVFYVKYAVFRESWLLALGKGLLGAIRVLHSVAPLLIYILVVIAFVICIL